jgi:hypothetical protein
MIGLSACIRGIPNSEVSDYGDSQTLSVQQLGHADVSANAGIVQTSVVRSLPIR